MTDDTAFDIATEAQTEVSTRLGDSDQGVDVMQLSGPVGRFTYIGQGAPLEYQVKPALMQAIEKSLDEILWAEGVETPDDAQAVLKDQLPEMFGHHNADYLAEETAATLADWADYHGHEGGDDEQ